MRTGHTRSHSEFARITAFQLLTMLAKEPDRLPANSRDY